MRVLDTVGFEVAPRTERTGAQRQSAGPLLLVGVGLDRGHGTAGWRHIVRSTVRSRTCVLQGKLVSALKTTQS